MLAQGRRRVALLAPGAGYAWKAWQGAERCAGFAQRPAGDAHTTCLRMWIVQRFVDGVERPKAGVDIGQFSNPFVTCLRFEDSNQQLYGLLALARAYRLVKRQQFEVPDTRAEGVPEFIFQGGQCDMLAVERFVNVVAGQAAVERGAPGLRSLTCIQIGAGSE